MSGVPLIEICLVDVYHVEHMVETGNVILHAGPCCAGVYHQGICTLQCDYQYVHASLHTCDARLSYVLFFVIMQANWPRQIKVWKLKVIFVSSVNTMTFSDSFHHFN